MNGIKNANFDRARRPYFQYNLWVHRHTADSSSSGVACNSRDFIVSLGTWGGSEQNGTVRQQSGTFMHELGHTLGLGHGGGDGINYKPNYLSIMSYRWQTVGLINSATGIATIDFSRVQHYALDETDLDETQAINDGTLMTALRDPQYNLRTAPGNGPFDWTWSDADGNGDPDDDTGVTVDINGDRICIRAGDDGVLDSSISGDDVMTGTVIYDGDDRTCNSSPANDDEYSGGRSLNHVQADILTGYDDWENIQYRAVMAAGAGGTIAPPPDEMTHEESLLIQAFWEAYLSVDAGSDQSVSEGDFVYLAPATFIDPGPVADAHTAVVDWGDGTVEPGVVTEDERGGTVDGSHAYADNGTYTVNVAVCDADGDCADDSLTVTVANVPPNMDAVPNQQVDELDTVELPPVQFSDPGFDCPSCAPATQEDFEATIDWGDGTAEAGVVAETPGSPGTLTVGTIAGSHVYGDNGTFSVQVSIQDDDGGLVIGEFEVVVDNVDPTPEIDETGTTGVNGVPTWIVHASMPIDFSGRITDPGSDDLHVSWDWDDGPPSPDVTTTYLVNPPNPDPSLSPSVQPRDVTDVQTHAFPDACLYIVGFLAEDDDSGHGSDSASVIIVGNVDQIRSAGYWLHQYRQNGKIDFDEVALQCYLDMANQMSRVFSEERPAATIQEAQDVLFGAGTAGSKEIFDRQLLAAWLNFANGAIEYDEMVDADGDGNVDMTFADVVAAAEAVRLDPGSTDAQIEEQKDILERINLLDG